MEWYPQVRASDYINLNKANLTTNGQSKLAGISYAKGY